MKKLLLSAALTLGLCAPAFAQVNTVPTVGVISNRIAQNTYSASTVGIVTASSATDFVCLNGSTSKNVSLKEILIGGTATTGQTIPVLINLNHSLDTGGTSPSSGLTLPVPVPVNTSDPAATATTTSYTANPTVNDTTPDLLAAPSVSFAPSASLNNGIIITAGEGLSFFVQGFDIIKAATVVQQICVNLNGITLAGPKVTVTFIWTEN